jgi:hypothetical protein
MDLTFAAHESLLGRLLAWSDREMNAESNTKCP